MRPVGCLTWPTDMRGKTYLCLLFAEIEAYQDASRLQPGLRFRPLDALLAKGNRSIQRVKQLRHSILHPENRVHLNSRWQKIYDAADSEFGGDHFGMALAVQTTLDDYLNWLREEQRKRLHQEIGELMEITHPPGLDEYRRLEILRAAKDVVSRPLPSTGYSSASDEVQTPPSILAWRPIIEAFATTSSNQIVYPERLTKVRAHCLQMLLRSVVFLSEAFSYLDIDKMVRYQREGLTKEDVLAEPFEVLLPAKVPKTEQHMQDYASLIRVSSALVAMPLRVYREVTQERPELLHTGIEELIREGFEQSTLDSFRNSVFHVPEPTIDPFQIDENQTMQTEAMPELLGPFDRILR